MTAPSRIARALPEPIEVALSPPDPEGPMDIPPEPQATPLDLLLDRTTREVLLRALLTLRPREERILHHRFGIGCREATLEEVGASMGIDRERVRQIEARALRKLKHPTRRNRIMATWGSGRVWKDHL